MPTVGTFVGRDPTRSVADNLRDAEQVFRPLVDRAGERGVKIVIENCVMEGWHPDGYPGNLAYSPELWEWMFAQGLYLNYDPSHLVWMGIDPVEAVRPYVDRVAHAQAKDIQVFPERRTRYGWPGRPSSARTPGTSAGGATASPASARSTGAPSSTPSTRAATTESSPSSTKTPSGVAPRTASRPACGSPTAPYDRFSSPDHRGGQSDEHRPRPGQQLDEEGTTT